MTGNDFAKEFRAGLFFALAAFGFWGLVQPYFFGFFEGVNPIVIAAHRTLWSCVLIWVWLACRGKLMSALGLFSDVRLVLVLAVSGLLITSNWATYIYAVQSNQLLDASVGYFMTPLMTASFGILFLGERPRRLQLIALGFAALGVLIYTVSVGQLPIIALVLSITFSAYGGIRKLFSAPAERGMAIETLLLVPIALVLIIKFGWAGGPYFIALSASQAALLVAAGLVTLLPLVWYNAAAVRMPLISLGLLQFITPFALFVLSLLPPLNEQLDPQKAIMFVLIWIGLLFYVVDLLRPSKRIALET